MSSKRLLLKSGAAMAAGILFARGSGAQGTSPIRLVVGFTPGSASDTVARVLAFELQKILNQAVIVDNRPGASAMIAAEYVARAAPDGLTLMLASNTALVANQFLFKTLRYDPVKDFTPIARLTTFPTFLVVNNKVPARNVQELVELGRRPDADLNYAYGDSTGQVAGSAFVRQAGIKATGVPYKSTPPALTDLIGGTVDFMFTNLTARPQIDAGDIRAIGVASPSRSPLMPSVEPIAAASGLAGFEMSSWHAVLGPARMPSELVERLHAAFNQALQADVVRAKFKDVGAEAVSMSLPQYEAFAAEQRQQWEGRIKAAGITPE